VRYTKPPLSFEQQADVLLNRGMLGDRSTMIERLRATNYYRLSGYWYLFREPAPVHGAPPLEEFRPGTTFEEVWARYAFDRHLRLLVMDAIERIEICVGTQLTYHHAHAHGAFAYATESSSLPKMRADEHQKFVERVSEEIDRSKDTFADHFRTKYGDTHRFLPAWMLAEVMTFGTMLTFYRGASKQVKQRVADQFDIPEAVLDSWLLMLNAVRNICAHHGRLWNRELGVKPYIPRINVSPDWHTPVKVTNNRLFAVLTICKWSLDRIAPQSQWPVRLWSLLDASPAIPRLNMGIPINWRACPIWNGGNS
jgi:abortive infection bacteriophage resistance protein